MGPVFGRTLTRTAPAFRSFLALGLLAACQSTNDPGTPRPETANTSMPIIFTGSSDAALMRQTVAPVLVHCDSVINTTTKVFTDIFDCGDAMFSDEFNEFDGVGANVGNGKRFTRVPRADLTGNDASGHPQWAAHTPARATGPNSRSCNDCHSLPIGDGAGFVDAQAVRDPERMAILAHFIERDTPALFGLGAEQRVAEEMTVQLQGERDGGRAGLTGAQTRSVTLTAKGVNFGTIVVGATAASDNTSGVVGVNPDLVVRPFQWKGSAATVRDFMTDAAHNELGMQAQEIVGAGVDGDGDGVVDELTYADITALASYMATQLRPTTKIELNSAGLLDPPLTAAEITTINQGQAIFTTAVGATATVGGVTVPGVGCATCHVPDMQLNSPIFTEPSQNANYREAVFAQGVNPVDVGVDPANPVTVNLVTQIVDNENIPTPSGGTVSIGGLVPVNAGNPNGPAHVGIFSDLKRHDMGAGLAEPVPDGGVAPNIWMTRGLWGVGATAPYLHDGRAATLLGAVLEHGGEALGSANAVRNNLNAGQRRALVAFLDNLTIFQAPDVPATGGGGGNTGGGSGGATGGGTPAVTASLTINTDWGAGFCATLNVSDAQAAAGHWSVTLTVGTGATISQLWNGTDTGTTGTVTVSSQASWQAIAVGQTNSSTGFCATRTTAPATLCTANPGQAACPRVVSASGTAG